MASKTVEKTTIANLAGRLSLSPTTVSMVLNGRASQYGISKATQEKVLAEAKRLNYHPNIVARQLLGKRSNVVGMLINTEAIADTRLVQKIEMLAAERGVRIIVGHAVGTRKEVDAYLDDFQARGVDAIISIFHNHPDYSRFVLPRLAQFERVVYFEQPAWDEADVPRKPDACYVAPDYYECQRLAVQHLIDRGRRRIALVMHNLVFPYAHARRRAHEETLKAAGQPFDERLVWIMDQQPSMRWTEPFTPERALLAVDELVLRQGADAIVAITDYYAARLVAAMRQRGIRIPDDVAIVGSDDFEIGTMIEPQLTTLDLRVDDLAQAVTEQLFGLLDHGVLPKDRRALVFAPRLVVRQST